MGVGDILTADVSHVKLVIVLQIKAAGVDLIVCTAVNDPFVMAAWGQAHKCEGKILMLADTHGLFGKALGISYDFSENLGNVRNRRFSMVVENNVITALNVEQTGQLSCSLSLEILKQI